MSNPADDTPVMPTLGTMKRLADRDKALSREPKSEPPEARGITRDRAIRFAKVTVQISAFNASSGLLGSGKAKLQYHDPADHKLKDYDPAIVVDVYNDIVGTVAVNKQIKIVIVDGAFCIFTAGC